ncbi:universal stress protein [Nitrosomonas eutropha]|uniref:universal stress protein n=1 Tax=Nitrosomonas eutropha TaxID=916 RepID=UPI0008B76B7A|nr:universal stress protein [Nitrosomonas eutropha]SEI95130.1 Nucleotide-binding universal stress protein, UspA family [Nitrosomonas eutropha]
MMIRRTLIPLDGSELAEQVIHHLLRFITPDQTELLLMTALSSTSRSLDEVEDTPGLPASKQTVVSKEDKARKQLYDITQKLNQIGFSVMDRLLSGMPAESILRLAEETFVDLIAMSTHGRTGLGRALLGSVADEVVCSARPPVFLAPAAIAVKSSSVPRTILLPLDGTPLAEAAIPIARQFAQNTGATISLIRVVRPNHPGYEQPDEQVSAGEQSVAHQAISYLERIQLQLQLANVFSRYQVASGDPIEAIIRTMHMEDSDLVVMSTHGRSGVERIIHGSVTRQIIGNTTCPLLLVRGVVPVEVYESSDDKVSAASFC